MADVSLKDRLAYVDQTITKTTEKGFLAKEDIETLRKLQGELKKIHEETEKLNAEVADLKAENIKLKKELENLREQVNTQEGRISQLLEENTVLKQDNVVLKQDNVVLKEDDVGLEGRLERFEDKLRYLVPSDDELVLGELCWSIQSMIFKRVLPLSEYNDKVGYNLRYIQEDINSLEDEHIEVARQAWAELQQELNYQQRDINRLTSILRGIQSMMNLTAHPELTEQILNDAAERMKGEGKLKGRPGKSLPELISLWKRLKAMGRFANESFRKLA